jgi:hypothetical protein
VKTTYVDQGESTCGYCYVGFTDATPPHEVTRRKVEVSGTYDYDEGRPWHADCITQANADLEAVKPA